MSRLLRLAVPDSPALQGADAKPRVTFGTAALDDRIGGGLIRAALHEVYACAPEDGSAAAAFAAMVALRACTDSRPVLWIREQRCDHAIGHLHAIGLAELGFDPGALVLVEAPHTLAALRVAAEAVKCAEVGAVVIEPWKAAPLLDLTASRRLSMAATVSGVMALTVRIAATPVPSAAQTRWQVAAAPSATLAAGAPGQPAFDIALLRHRGGLAGFEARVEWNRDERCFAPLSGGIPAVAAIGTDRARVFGQRHAA